MTKPKVVLFSDGSCLGNPGRGGWGVIMRWNEKEKELSQGYIMTTNNRMELTAAIEGLSSLKCPCEVELYTDSRYVCDAIEKNWIQNWQAKNWKTSAKKPVKNVDLWQKLLPLLQIHQVKFNWVEGHSGHKENERCDYLAKKAAQAQDLLTDDGFMNEEA